MQDYSLSGPRVNHKAVYRDAQEAAWRAQRGTDVARDAALRTLAAQAATRYAGEQLRISKGLVIALNGGVTLQADGTALVRSQSEPEMVYEVNGHCDCPDATHGAPDGRCKHRWSKTFTTRALALTAPPVETISTLSEQLYGPQDAAAAAQRTACGQPAARKDSPMATVTTDPDDDDPTLQAAMDEYNQLARAATQQPTAPAACPEAMFSITLKGTMGGQDVLLTARGGTYEEFMTNVQRLQGLLDTPASPPVSAPASPAGSQAASPPPAAGWCGTHQTQMTLNPDKGRGSWWSHRTAEGWCKGK